MPALAAPGQTLCDRCRKHRFGRLWKVTDPHTGNGAIVCESEACRRQLAARWPDAVPVPAKVRCLQGCMHLDDGDGLF